MKHNWEYKKLGEVCDFIGGGTPSKSKKEFYEGKIPWATVRDMTEFKLSSTEFHITQEAVDKSATNIIPKGMIVISTHVGLGKISQLMQDTAINQDLKAIKFKDDTVSKFFFVFWYNSIAPYIINRGRGATVKGVTLDFMRNLNIPIPPKDVQEQIVAELDAINEGIAELKEQIKDLDNLAQTLFYETFGDPISNPKGWEVKKLLEVSPISPSIQTPLAINGKFWLLNLDQIESQTGKIIEKQFFKLSDIGNSTTMFDEDNVLYSKLRPYLNKVVVPDSTGYGSSELLPFRPKKEVLSREYLARALRSNEFVEHINEKTGGAKMPRVKMEYLRNFLLPVPPLPLQQQFAVQIEAIEKMKGDLEAQIADAQTLLDSRMDYWFN